MTSEFFFSQLELILIFEINYNGLAASQTYTRYVGYVARLRDYDFVPWIKHGTECKVDSFGTTNSDYCFCSWIIGNVIFSFIPFTDFFSKFDKSRIRCVVGLASLERIDSLVYNMPRGIKIWFASTERDSIWHLAYDVEELSDSRRLHILNYFINRFHKLSSSIKCD